MQELVGNTVYSIYISPDDEQIVFETDAGRIAYKTDGECCSSTWIESLTGVDALLGQKVVKHETVDMPEPEDREYKSDHYVEVLADYGEKLVTKNGVFDLVYRNSSNGYYGGSLNHLRQAPAIEGFKEITDDWVAA